MVNLCVFTFEDYTALMYQCSVIYLNCYYNIVIVGDDGDSPLD